MTWLLLADVVYYCVVALFLLGHALPFGGHASLLRVAGLFHTISLRPMVQESDEAVAFTQLTFEEYLFLEITWKELLFLPVVKWKSIVLSILIQIYAYWAEVISLIDKKYRLTEKIF